MFIVTGILPNGGVGSNSNSVIVVGAVGWPVNVRDRLQQAKMETSFRLRRPMCRSFELEFDLNRPKSRPLVRPGRKWREGSHFGIGRVRSDKAA